VVFSFHDNKAAAEDVVAAVDGCGGRAFAVQADQGRMQDLERLFDQADQHLGGLDILVNNAGINPLTGILDVAEPDYDRVMAVNAKGPFFAMQYAARTLPDGGRIINISTLSTVLPVPGKALYVASKRPSSSSPRLRPGSSEAGGSPSTASLPGSPTPTCCAPPTLPSRSRRPRR
jgi:3-oxoacyl-[acyl-carrier protein] reductase